MVIAALLLALGLGGLPTQTEREALWRVDDMPAEQHPCLLFTADDLPRIRERLERLPYADWWSSVSASGNMVAQAFTWRITGDEEKAQAVRQRLLKCNPTGYHCSCGVADALQGVAEAYDLIYDYEGLSETDHRVIRAKMANACERLYLSALESGSGQHPGNQRTRGICALGTAAMVLSGYEDSAHTPQEWLQRALDGIHDEPNLVFWRDDGMFIEGPGYSSFTLSVMLPFARYYHNFSGNWLFDDPRLRNALHYIVHITQPDGQCAAIGTTNMGSVVNALKLCVGAGPERDQAFYRWALEEWGSLSGGGVREICLFDADVKPSISGFSTRRFFPVSQEASLRSEWSKNAVALWFKGKDPWLARTHRVYSHGDVGSFVIHAYGELLAVDAGYDHWVSYDLYPPELHNTLLVDGEGPVNETPGVMTNIIDAQYVQAADIVTEYAGIKLRRTFILVEDEYIVIIDDIEADEEHEYEWLIHTPVSRETGEITIDGNRASWTSFDPRTDNPGKVALDVLWAGTVEVEAMEESRWQPWSSNPETGSYDNWAVVARQHGQNVKFLTVLCPRLAEKGLPGIRQVRERPIEGGLGVHLPGPREGGTVVVVRDGAADLTPEGPAAARICLMRSRGALAWVYVGGPGKAVDGQQTVLELDDLGAAAAGVGYSGGPSRVYVAGPAGMTASGRIARPAAETSFVWADGSEVLQPAPPTEDTWSFELRDAVRGPASVIALPEGRELTQDHEPPTVKAVSIDGEALEPRELIDLGRVDSPPEHIQVEFADEGAGVAAGPVYRRLNGLSLPYSRPWASENVTECKLGPLQDPIDYELTVGVTDGAPIPNQTQLTLKFSMRPLLANGGFEEAGGWAFGAWSRNDETKYETKVVADNPHSGNRCLMMKGIAGGLNMVASQTMPLKLGSTYVLSGFFRGDVAAKASLCNGPGTGQYIFSEAIGPSDEWMPFEWQFTVENPSPQLIVAFRLGQVGTAYFDDVELKKE